jgi:hypothetical protein
MSLNSILCLHTNLGFNRLSDDTPIEISDRLNAGLSFSESPKYNVPLA